MGYELYLSGIADNGSFALEYYFLKLENKENLLQDGIKYCNLMIDATHKSIYIQEDNEKQEKINTIKEYHIDEKLLKYIDTAIEIKDVLFNILHKKEIYLSEEKIRSYQHFF